MSQEVMLIDPLRFADESRRKTGTLPLSAFSRLTDGLVERAGEVTFLLEGSRDKEGKRLLALSASTTLTLVCQRCLETMRYPLSISNQLWLVPSGYAIPQEELEIDHLDAIEVEAQLDVVQLLEEELLLALPMAPRHPACDGVRPVDGADAFSPFSGLAVLKKQH